MRREYPEAPIVSVGLIVSQGDRVLIVQRGKEPAKGKWSIPGGAVNVGESLRSAGEREVREECGIVARAGALAEVFESITADGARTRFHYVVIDFLAEYVSGVLTPGSDSMDARWVTRAELAAYEMTDRARELLLRLLTQPQV
jgi:ADP-ribose pyrophosphatase YjhB (NUDIX family)